MQIAPGLAPKVGKQRLGDTGFSVFAETALVSCAGRPGKQAVDDGEQVGGKSGSDPV